MSFSDEFFNAMQGQKAGATHNAAGVRVVRCQHNADVPPRGWCVYCDKPGATGCTHKPAKVTFEGNNAVDGEYRAFAIAKEEQIRELGWEIAGWIMSGPKRIAVVARWNGDGVVLPFTPKQED